jgi:hypothetical protein
LEVTKKYLSYHPADCQLEYIYFMKIGQPELSERKSQRSGLVVQLIFSVEMIQELMIIEGNVHKPAAY